MMEEFGLQVKNIILEKNLAKTSEIEGCTDNEIKKIMDVQGVDYLPDIYISFLKYLGKTSGKLWRGHDFNYDSLLWMKQDAIDIANISESMMPYDVPLPNFVLPARAFIVLMLDGMVFHYFDTEDHDPDPAVFFFSEYEFQYGMSNSRLSEFLLDIR